MRRDIWKAIGIAAFLCFHLFLFSPLFVYFSNRHEFQVTFPVILLYLVPSALCFLLIIGGLMSLLALKGLFRLAAALAGLCAYLYLQFYVFVWDYGPLDGKAIHWDQFRSHGFLEVAVLLLLLTVALLGKDRFFRVTGAALIFLIAVEASAVLYQAATRNAVPRRDSAAGERWESIHELSATRNVIIILIDTLQSDVFEEILRDDPGLSLKLNGFTNFPDTVGAFPYTYPSLQAILTGMPIRAGETMEAYRARIKDHYLPTIVAAHGGLASSLDPWSNANYLAGSHVSDRHELAELMDVSLFRQAPHFLKPAVLNGYGFRFRGLVTRPEARFPVQRDLAVLDTVTRRSFVGNGPLTFKFFHLWGSHPPAVISTEGQPLPTASQARSAYKNQSVCVLNRVAEYLGRLKQLGVFDQSLIVVLSDHGADFPVPGTVSSEVVPDSVIRSALPALAVKDFGHRGPLRVSRSPVALTDLAGTVLRRLGLAGTSDNGPTSIFEIPEDSRRVRTFSYFSWGEGVNVITAGRIDEYQVTGFSRDPRSWRVGKPYYNLPESRDPVIDLGTKESLPFLGPGWSPAEAGVPTCSWSLGKRTVVAWRMPNRPSVRIVARLRTFLPEQTVHLALNGRTVAGWKLPPTMEFKEYDAKVELDPSERGVVCDLAFVIGKSGRPRPEDPRELGISADWIKFE